jgi:cell division septation protein DedD
MPSKTFPAKWSSKCEVCGQEILENQTIGYKSRFSKNPSHERCLTSPPVASSVGQGGPKPAVARGGMTTEQRLPSASANQPAAVPAQEDTFMVLVGAYVWSDKADLVVKAIREARK